VERERLKKKNKNLQDRKTNETEKEKKKIYFPYLQKNGFRPRWNGRCFQPRKFDFITRTEEDQSSIGTDSESSIANKCREWTVTIL